MGEDSDGNQGTDQITLSVIDSATIDTPKGTARLSATDGIIIGACRGNESLLPALSGVEFPFGVFTFNISELSNGQTVNVTIGLPQELPSDAKYWKFWRTICDTTPHWYEIPMAITLMFDTKASTNQYPGISGTHTGTLKLTQPVEVQKLYTYPCAGTGGHTE